MLIDTCYSMYAYMLSHFSCVRLFPTLWTVARQAPLSMGFSRQECWSGLPCPPPGNLPNPGIKPASLTSANSFYTAGATWKACYSMDQFSSVAQTFSQFSHSVVSNSLRPHGLQHAIPSCTSPTPRVCSNSCPLSW